MEMTIPLKGGKFARVDAIDYEALKAKRWHMLNGQYARTTVVVGNKTKTVLMHRLILGAMPGQLVDHVNGDGLDNRRSNLRIASAAENARNAAPKGGSGYVGVKRVRNKWQASIAPDGHEIFLGLWGSKEDASSVYAAAAEILYGDFASRHAEDAKHDLLAEVIRRKRERIALLQKEITLLGV